MHQAHQYRYQDDMRPAYRPWQVSARMESVIDQWRARSAPAFEELRAAQGRAPCGRVD